MYWEREGIVQRDFRTMVYLFKLSYLVPLLLFICLLLFRFFSECWNSVLFSLNEVFVLGEGGEIIQRDFRTMVYLFKLSYLVPLLLFICFLLFRFLLNIECFLWMKFLFLVVFWSLICMMFCFHESNLILHFEYRFHSIS